MFRSNFTFTFRTNLGAILIQQPKSDRHIRFQLRELVLHWGNPDGLFATSL
jgi:hypothetical protein